MVPEWGVNKAWPWMLSAPCAASAQQQSSNEPVITPRALISAGPVPPRCWMLLTPCSLSWRHPQQQRSPPCVVGWGSGKPSLPCPHSIPLEKENSWMRGWVLSYSSTKAVMKNIITHSGLKHVIVCYVFSQHRECVRSGRPSAAAKGNIFLWLFFTWRVLRHVGVCCLLLVGDRELLSFLEGFEQRKNLLFKCYWGSISLGEFSVHNAQNYF